MKYILSLLFLSSCISIQAQTNWDVAKIPETLTKDAVMIIRNEEQFLDIKSPSAAKYEYKITATILSKAADDFAEMQEVYDKFSNIYNIKATLYDASGKKIKEYKSADIKDQSLISGFSIFEDNRLKNIKFVSNSYPYTIEYSFSQDFKGLLYFPQWRDLKDFGVSVEKSSYTIQKSKDYQMKYIASTGLKVDSSTTADKVIYKWQSTAVPALSREPLATGIDNVSAWVKASPNLFEYDGSSGNFNTWKNFGQWIYTLNEGGNNLPEAFRAKIQALTKDAKSAKEKMHILYQYLQQNTRYVSVQLGIGGFKPILAEKVAMVNYGDCKALSNFMKAMLNEVGIASNLVMIGNGKPSLHTQYSSIGQANHMILAVPSATDTTFLECTSQYYPMGFIGYGNANRKVLLVTESGGKLVNTPIYTAKNNYQTRKTSITFNNEQDIDVLMNTTYGNAQFEDNLSTMLLQPNDQKKKVLESSEIPIATFGSYKCEQVDKNKPEITEEIAFKAQQLLSKGGDKLFLVLNQVNRKESAPIKVENRKTFFSVPYAYDDEDEITFKLPKGYQVDFIPKDIVIESEFGNYTAKFNVQDDQIVYRRTQTMNGKTYPPEKYNTYVDFYKKIVQADKQKAVITKSM
ncbi:DUF3857 domain-containing protein [Sphingobacterium sp. SRCM116780]|uniref:DUF3857 domain-containing protein n=1 Tax=Sphingobacterium sp. SRCM116780 TaxID=2907623 RepID=UPI001F2C5499|nr:DUF3857 domain-containing protein [Sphingobacterium sp. SRCM116780]UIR57493.1 DUF3857 domain-containing protein [Sphingobacterium sp. SRCM116780]